MCNEVLSPLFPLFLAWGDRLDCKKFNLLFLAQVTATSSEFVENSGGAIGVLGNESAVTVEESLFKHNTANLGAALFSWANATATLTRCSLLDNVATLSGGCVHSSDSQLNLLECQLTANRAGNGGAVFISLGLQNTTIRGCNFTNNTAKVCVGDIVTQEGAHGNASSVPSSCTGQQDAAVGNGAAFYIMEGPVAAAAIAANLTIHRTDSLRYEGNVAQGGGSVMYWKPVDTQTASAMLLPPCEGCVLVGETNTAAYAAYASPLAALAMDVVPAQAGGHVSDPIRVTLVDIFQQVVTTENALVVTLQSGYGSPCSVDRRRVTSAAGEVIFPGETFEGAPGALCLLEFSATLETGETFNANANVALRQCELGEELVGETCRACKGTAEGGYLSFANESACVSCEGFDGVDCSAGRDVYSINQGYWVPPNAEYCADDTECFLRRILPCSNSDACSSEEAASRIGAGAVGAYALREVLCENSAYLNGVLCGGGQYVLCTSGHYHSVTLDKCLPCLDRIPTFFSALIALAVLLVAVSAITYALTSPRFNTHKDKLNAEYKDRDAVSDTLKVQGVVALILGYMQVMGQLGDIFPTDSSIMPNNIRLLAGYLGVVNVRFDFMLNLGCFTHYFIPGVSQEFASSFLFSFWQSVAMPFVILLGCWVGFRLFSLYAHSNGGSDTQDEKLALWRKAVSVKVAVFLLMLLHPGISMTIFQLFNCDSVNYESPDGEQYWVHMDYRMECFDSEWMVASAFAIIMLVVYVMGLPVALLVVMLRLRSFVAASINLGEVDAEELGELYRNGKWVCIYPSDKIFVEEVIAKSASASDRTVRMHLSLDSFEEQEQEQEQGQGHARQGAENPLAVTGGSLLDTEPTSVIIMKSGRSMTVTLHKKKDLGEGGEVTMVPVTSMDSEESDLAFNQLYGDYEDSFFHWQCYEIIRRLLQTGMVLVIDLLLGLTAAIASAVVVSVLAILVHQRYSPFTSDDLDNMQLMILVNQFFVQFFLFCIYVDDSNIELAGLTLLLLQVLLVGAAVHYMRKALRCMFEEHSSTKSASKSSSGRAVSKKGVSKRLSFARFNAWMRQPSRRLSFHNSKPSDAVDANDEEVMRQNPAWQESFTSLPIVLIEDDVGDVPHASVDPVDVPHEGEEIVATLIEELLHGVIIPSDIEQELPMYRNNNKKM
ncbi:hypothetical protein CYMTET_47875 [Cymbomonas tetramitiformis]|uniref:Right handed beta helix domain-containing protein n=1 Tax=Cymbomonas tetramitiformis TaxID=36881 RepID=A0AAE0BUW5_9CHLO|nr:hypothetical protein CYMTET_47875 [Cymbomonas tetramitiformis]